MRAGVGTWDCKLCAAEHACPKMDGCSWAAMTMVGAINNSWLQMHEKLRTEVVESQVLKKDPNPISPEGLVDEAIRFFLFGHVQ